MDAGKTIQIFLNEREKNIIQLVSANKKSLSKDEFHNLRVEIKKLKAGMLILKHSNPSFQTRQTFHPFLHLFKAAGHVREIQLHRAHLSEIGQLRFLPSYRRFLAQKLSENEARFYIVRKNVTKSVVQHAFRKAKDATLAINTEQLNKYLLSRQEKICKLIGKDRLKVSQTHDLRKAVKSFYFLSGLFPLREKKLKRLNSFQELLGRWHDYEVMTEDLEKAMKHCRLLATESKRMENLISKTKKERALLFQKIHQKKKQVLIS
ncbi:MAG TPA: CHAD domain-containing protein [Bacteroidia bacterium]|nr:CHAD domain-containing protein [Bacteroidia bacterium]